MTNSAQPNSTPKNPPSLFSIMLTNSIFWGMISGAVYEILFKKFDRTILYWMQKNASPFYTKASHEISTLFSTTDWLILAIFCLIIGLCLRRWFPAKTSGKNLLFISASLLITAVIGGVIKYSLARYRPEMLLEKNLYGFHFFSTQHDLTSTPSGHTMMSVAGLMALSHIIKKSWVTWIFLILIVAIGLSRIILSEHYASDVLLGIYIGSLSVYWVKFFQKKYE